MNKQLQPAISKLQEDDVRVKVEPTNTGNQLMSIRTKKYRIVLGASDLGGWLDAFDDLKTL